MRAFLRVNLPKRVTTFLLVLLFIQINLFPLNGVEANSENQGSTPPETYTLDDFDYKTDINYQGVVDEHVFGVTIPRNWSLTDSAILTIDFSHSNLLDPSSILYAEWNGERIGTIPLTEENAQHGALEITLPAVKVNQGYNALQIGFYMGISTDFCTDYKNQGVWAVVHNDTSIEVSHEIVAVEKKLSNIPDILVDSSLLAENQITMVMPGSPSLQALNALSVISTKLGQWADWRNIKTRIMTIDEARRSKPSGNIIILATIDELEGLSGSLLPEIDAVYEQYAQHNSLGDDDGIISLQTSPFSDHYQILILTGKSPDAIEKSARAAAFDELYAQSNGTWAVVRSLTDIIERVPNPLEMTFSQLGYPDQSVSGTLEQTIQYSLPISNLWNIDSEAWIDLYFTHSELINRDLSSVSVLVNAIPVSSFELNSENAEEGYKEIRIPLRYLSVGENIIAFKVKMQFSDEMMLIQDRCSPEATPRAWLNISSDSTIRLPEVPMQINLNLSNFPFGFIDPFTFDGFAFVVPSSLDSAEIEGLISIAIAIGKASLGNPASINLLFWDQDLTQFDGYSHIILLGKAGAIISESINSMMPLPLDALTGLPQDNPAILIVETPSGIRAFLEAFSDSKSTSYLVLVSDKTEGVSVAGEFLSNPSVRYALNGNVAVITSSESANAYQIEPAGNSSNDMTLTPNEEPLTILSGQSIWVVRVAMGMAGLSVIVLLIALFRKNSSSKES